MTPDAPGFPFVRDRADPQVFRHDGIWYLLATDDTLGDNVRSRRLAIRSAATVDGLADAEDIELVGVGAAGITGCFWAPEAHMIGGRLRILFSPSIEREGWTAVHSHIMTLRSGGDPGRASDWSEPARIVRRDGRDLQRSGAGICLDMTYLAAGGRHFYVWSQRQVHPDLTDAELWIAPVHPEAPERLAGEPVRLLAPELDWERRGAAVVEGPFALVQEGVVHLTYSAAAVGPDYATGVLTAADDADLLDPRSWRRRPQPALSTDADRGEYGPGHVSFFRDRSEIWMAYHAMTDRRPGPRHTGIRRVDVTAAGDLDLRLASEGVAR